MHIILLRGRPGSGKTFTASKLARRLQCPYLSKDMLHDILLTHGIETLEGKQMDHAFLQSWLSPQADIESQIILDFPFNHDQEYQSFFDFCTHTGIKLTSVVVTCSDEQLWRERLKKRAEHPAPNQMITDYDEFVERYGSMIMEPKSHELLVDSVHDIEQILGEVEGFMTLNKEN